MRDTTRNNGNETGERKKPMPPVEHRFKPGNPGRPKGSRNKLGEEFLAALHADFQEHGVQAIERVRTEKPDAYLKVIASLLPKDLNVSVSRFADMSDAELMGRIRRLNAELGLLDDDLSEETAH